jgi:hypothetical protein
MTHLGPTHLKNNAIKSVDVRNGELRAVDFRASDFASLKGATGAKGDKGDKGDAGTAVAYARVNADGSLDLTRSKGADGGERRAAQHVGVLLPRPSVHRAQRGRNRRVRRWCRN